MCANPFVDFANSRKPVDFANSTPYHAEPRTAPLRPPVSRLDRAGTQWEYGTAVDPERFKQTDKIQSTIMDPPKGGVGLQRALTKAEMFGMMQKFK